MFPRLGRTLTLAVLAVALFSGAAAAQFQTRTYYAGPRMWVGNLNGAVALGGQIERGLTEPGRYGPGVISVGAGLDWYSWSYDYPSFGSYDYTVVPVQVFGNYHFPLESNPKVDPFLGLALVYSHVSASWSGAGAQSFGASASGTDFAGVGGVRYFFSQNLAFQGQVGFGYGTLSLGATWRL